MILRMQKFENKPVTAHVQQKMKFARFISNVMRCNSFSLPQLFQSTLDWIKLALGKWDFGQ